MEISHVLLCFTFRSTLGCITMEGTFCTVFCHTKLIAHVSWPGSFEMVLCTTTRLLDCTHLMVLGGELAVLCSGHSKASEGKKTQTNKMSCVDRRELCLKSWTSITLQTVSELGVVP